MIQKIIAPLLLLSAAGLLGCSAHKPPQFHLQNNVARITYNSRHCHELRDKRVICKDVIFTRKSVSVEDLRQDQ